MDKACVYCLATDGEVQRLSDLAQRHGWTVAQTLTEHPATAPEHRAGLAAIRRMLAKGEVQALVVPSLLMLGASLDEIVDTISRLVAAKADLLVAGEVDSTTREGTAWMAAIASLQGVHQALRHQRARAGQLRAKEAGVRFGRPPISDSTMRSVRTALAAGAGVRPTARKLGISPARVHMEKLVMKCEQQGKLACEHRNNP